MTFTLTSEWRPDQGGLRHDFEFDPLHYGVGGDRRAQFKQRVRTETQQYGFVLTGEVAVRWELLVDEQSRWESDTGADVDNFAKLLNDAVTGPGGLLIDDAQIQRLEVAWLPALGLPRFELTVNCHPDEWASRPLSLYEMFSGLWHPISDLATMDDHALAMVLHRVDNQVRRVWRVRHHLRQIGATREQAFQATLSLGPLSQGFHVTRARTAGLPMIGRAAWTARVPRPRDYPDMTEDDYRVLAQALLR